MTERQELPQDRFARETLEALRDSIPRLQLADPELAGYTQYFLDAVVMNPELRESAAFYHTIAWFILDAEAGVSTPLAISPQTRAEVTKLARFVTGLENKRWRRSWA